MEGKGVGLQRNKLKGILKVKKNNIFLDQDPPVKGGSEIWGGGVGVKFIDGFKKRKILLSKIIWVEKLKLLWKLHVV